MRASTSLRAQIQARVGTLSLAVELDTGGGALAIVGPNGAGKTSLLATLLGARHVEAGKITVGETVLLDTATRLNVPVEERRLGYVPQDYALFPHLNVKENVLFALRSSMPRIAESERAARADETLHSLDILPLADRKPSTLSGGERQRVALARALAVEPRALLLDEPLAALDVHARRAVRAFLAQTLERLALPTVLITHDPADVRALAQQVLVLESGAVTQLGTLAALRARPATPFVEEFVAVGA